MPYCLFCRHISVGNLPKRILEVWARFQPASAIGGGDLALTVQPHVGRAAFGGQQIPDAFHTDARQCSKLLRLHAETTVQTEAPLCSKNCAFDVADRAPARWDGVQEIPTH